MTGPLGANFLFIRNGMNVKQDKSGDGLPITRIETIWNETIDPSRVGYASLEEPDARRWLLEPGDILFSHINSVEHIGKCAVYRGAPGKLVHGMNLLCLRSDRSKLDPEFAKYLLRSPQFKVRLARCIKRAVNQASVSIGDLQSIPISVPAISEQRRIAKILDETDALRAKRRAVIAQLDTLTQSIFLDMFGDPAANPRCIQRKRLASLTPEEDTINYGVVQPGDDVEEGIPLIRVGDLQDGRVNTAELKRISPAIEASYKRSRLRGDEILISCVGSTGVIALADSSMKGFNIARAVARVPVAASVDRIYLANYLKTNAVQRYFKAELRTVSQPTLNIKQISETEVLIPSIEMQREFASRAAAVERLKSLHQRSQRGHDLLFASMQRSAFLGEL